jgi:hypothetical protein
VRFCQFVKRESDGGDGKEDVEGPVRGRDPGRDD